MSREDFGSSAALPLSSEPRDQRNDSEPKRLRAVFAWAVIPTANLRIVHDSLDAAVKAIVSDVLDRFVANKLDADGDALVRSYFSTLDRLRAETNED